MLVPINNYEQSEQSNRRLKPFLVSVLGFIAACSLSPPAIADIKATQMSPIRCMAVLDEEPNDDQYCGDRHVSASKHSQPPLSRNFSQHVDPVLNQSQNGHLQRLVGASPNVAEAVDIDPAIIESSPVLRRWLEEVPDVATDIQHDPAFRTRLRIGYAEFPSKSNTGGIYIGVQDLFIGSTPLTLSAEYATNFQSSSELIGADAQYYLLPLGWYGNIAPVLGYRSIETPTFSSEGLNVGFRVVLIPSRTGAVDLSVAQSWVAPGTENEVGLTTFSAGYAIAQDFRISTDIQTQNARDQQESRVSLLVEWMP